jgi:cytochrome c-type biogenesis protein CcmH/NrfG
MTQSTRVLQREWTNKQALILMTLCLLVGIAGGWFMRGGQVPIASASAQPVAPATRPTDVAPAAQPPDPARLKQMADQQAAPLLAKLNADPNNPDLLTGIGNLYYDAQQYPIAVDYYSRTLNSRPSDAAVRTDMATAYWYMGNADMAISEFNKALTYAPNSPNTLFNLGLVKWQGKHDAAGAISDWKKLLAANPNYEAKDKVERMLADVEKQAGAKPGI